MHRGVRGEVGEDEDLVAGLYGVEGLRPHPGRARHAHGEVAAGRADQPRGEQRGGQAGVDDDAVALERAAGDLLERDLVLHAAVDHGVDAAHAGLCERASGGAELVTVGVAGGGDAVADDQHALVLAGVVGDVLERAGEVGGAEGVAFEDRLLGVGAEAAGLAGEHGLDGLVEAEHAQLEVVAGGGAQLLDDLAEARDLALEVDGPRGAGVEQQGDAGDRLLRELDVRGDAGDGESVIAQADLGAAARGGQLEVLLRHEVLLPQAQVLGARGARDDDIDAEVLELGQAAQVQAVGLAVAGQGLGVGDDDLLDTIGGDREHAGAEAVAGVLLEQGGVLAAVQGVLVGAAGGLELDDLGLHPLVVDLHGEARDGRAGRQRDLEAALDHARLGVTKHHGELGEGERVVDDGAGVEREQLEADALAGGEREGGDDVAGGLGLAPLEGAFAGGLTGDIAAGRLRGAGQGDDGDEAQSDDGEDAGHEDSRLASVAGSGLARAPHNAEIQRKVLAHRRASTIGDHP